MKKKIKKCAYCQKEPISSELGLFPFCSKRCKTEDLDNWAAGRYLIKGQEPNHVEDNDAEDNDFSDPNIN